MGETDQHRSLMNALIETLQSHFANDPLVYVSGNLFVHYEPGNRRRHLSPDVFFVRGVPNVQRLNYLVWEEGKGPDVIIEVTSRTTRDEDVDDKFTIYQDQLKVPEYFLFDPLGDYLDPPLRGYRLKHGKYAPIRPVKGRLPSAEMGLHLERLKSTLRLFDPQTNRRLPTPAERIVRTEAALERTEAENERLRREVEELRRKLKNGH